MSFLKKLIKSPSSSTVKDKKEPAKEPTSTNTTSSNSRKNSTVNSNEEINIGEIDLVFVIDTTGSMGSYIESVRTHVSDIVTKIEKLPVCKSLRYGLIEYKDHCDPVVVNVAVPLTSSIGTMKSGLAKLQASGGGDYPEAVTDGLYQLVRMDWRPSAVKTGVLIADAPPHGVNGSGDNYPEGCPCGEEWLEQAESAREMGIIIHTVACSGLNPLSVFQKIAMETWGQFLNLSNASSLPQIITGVAEADLDKLRIKSEVEEGIKKYKQILKDINSESDRVRVLHELMSSKDSVTVRTVNTRFAVETTPLTRLDVEQGIASLKRTSAAISDVCEIFPSIGFASVPKAKGGLFQKDNTDSMVPLLGVDVGVKIVDFCCEVEISQTYKNSYDHPIEAVYQFPIDELAAVTGFVAEIDGKRIIAKCMEKEKAAQVYADSLAEGKGAYLLEQKSADVFSMSVGNLPSGKQVKIRITYVAALEYENGLLRFVLPTTVAPKYAPSDIKKELATLLQDGNLNTKERNEGPQQAKVPYKLTINATVESQTDIAEITSPSHKLAVQFDKGSKNRASVHLADAEAELNSDFLLLIKESKAEGPRLLIEEWDPTPEYSTKEKVPQDIKKSLVAMLSYNPQFSADRFDDEGSADLVLLLDCSASMIGAAMNELKKAGKYFLELVKDAPSNVHWNLGIFGSNSEFAFSKNSKARKAKEAEALLEKIGTSSNLGGTEIHKVLKKLPEMLGRSQSVDVILLTDGEVGNSENVLSWLKGNEKTVRVFPVGVGYSVSHSAIRGLASASKTAPEFCYPGDSIEPKIQRHFERILASLKSTSVEKSGAISVTPTQLPPVIHNTRQVLFAFLTNASGEVADKEDIVIKGKLSGKEQTLSIGWKINGSEFTASFDASKSVKINKGKLIHRLAARSMIRELEPTPNSEKQVVELATKYNLGSKFTSFVAVEERDEVIEQSAELVNVPSQLPKKDDVSVDNKPQAQKEVSEERKVSEERESYASMPSMMEEDSKTSLKKKKVSKDKKVAVKREEKSEMKMERSKEKEAPARRSSLVKSPSASKKMDASDYSGLAPSRSAAPKSKPPAKAAMVPMAPSSRGPAPPPAPGGAPPPPRPTSSAAPPPPPPSAPSESYSLLSSISSGMMLKRSEDISYIDTAFTAEPMCDESEDAPVSPRDAFEGFTYVPPVWTSLSDAWKKLLTAANITESDVEDSTKQVFIQEFVASFLGISGTGWFELSIDDTKLDELAKALDKAFHEKF